MVACAPGTSDGIRRALESLRPDPKLDPATWAERYRVLVARHGVSEPGPYRLSRTPYLREILETLGSRDTSRVVLVAPAQSGKSEAARSWIGWITDQSPGPVLIVFPTQDACRETMTERVIPMFRDTPRLAQLMSDRAWDTKNSTIALRSCSVYVGWAGSPQALASRPIQWVILDEVDKYPAYRGKEADPMSLADIRTRSYAHRSRVFALSTPTIPSGPIMRAYDACVDRRELHVACLSCGDWGALDWERVVWDGRDADDEASLRQQQAALASGELVAGYSCEACGYVASDAERWRMVEAAEWRREPGSFPGGDVGFKLSGLASPWVSWTLLAQEFVTARLGGIDKIHHFYNSILGLPFWAGGAAGEKPVEIPQPVIWAKSHRSRYGRGEVPEWADCLIASADPGKHVVPWGLRAWRYGWGSHLVDCGEAGSLEELGDHVLLERWPVAGRNSHLRTRLLMVDAGGGQTDDGTQTEKAYRFAQSDPARIKPLLGARGEGQLSPIVTSTHTYHPPGQSARPLDVTRSVIDTTHFKDLLAGRILDEDRELWSVFRGVDGRYVAQLCAEVRRMVERRVKPATGEVKEIMRWVPRVPGAANHFWDVEVYNGVGAYMLDLERKPATVGKSYRRQEQRDERRRRRSPREGGDWIVGRG